MQAVKIEGKSVRKSDQKNMMEIDPSLLPFTKPVFKGGIDENERHVKTLKEINLELMRLKLSRNEVKIYLYLARYGAQKAQKIADILDFQRTEAYKILKNLESKGIIYRILERPMKFSAVPLQKLLDIEIENRRQRVIDLEKKRNDFLRLWEELPKTDENDADKETIQVLDGNKYTSARICEILKSSKEFFNAVFTHRQFIWIYNSSFFEELNSISKKKGIDVKILTDYSEASLFVLEQIDRSLSDFGFLHLNEQPSFIISDSGCILFIENEDGRFNAIETNYNALSNSYRNLFSLLWKNKENR